MHSGLKWLHTESQNSLRCLNARPKDAEIVRIPNTFNAFIGDFKYVINFLPAVLVTATHGPLKAARHTVHL